MRPFPPLLAPALLLATFLVACGPKRQELPPVAQLGAATDTVTLNDTELSQGVWLGGDRWALLAPQAKAVRIVDLGRHSATLLGRPGKEYREPFFLFRAGDTLYVDDWGMRRITAWSLGGKLLDTLGAPGAFRGALPRARDAAGWWYAELRPAPLADGSGNKDSGAVVRWRSGPAPDTVRRLAPYDVERVTRDGASRYERLVFSATDQWDVRPDGTLWIARVNSNALERCAPDHGPCVVGPSLPDPVLEVTLQDREYFLQSFPAEERNLAEGIPFAVLKPPFDAAFTAGDGAVWFQRSRALTDTTRGYRILTLDGHAVQEYRIKNAQRILGADSTHILAIDPLVPGPGHRVLRYAVPK
ncbi:MAG TPA: hypothetical protein VFI13_05655 [Gemmatimonadales bacterium]|nr:hypothetical protein [Gemmatimonadales bacterium]